MLKWYEQLYVGDNAKNRINYYIRRISNGKPVKDIYLVTLASNGVDQLDIIKSNYVLQPIMKKMCPMIVGIAKGYDEARALVVSMAMDSIKTTGDADIRKYIMQR